MADWSLLIESYYKRNRRWNSSKIDELILEVFSEAMKKGKGTDLEQAIVDALNGTQPKHFQDFAVLAAADLKERYGIDGGTKLSHGTISPEWKEWGGADATSKSDVQFGSDGVSMKMGASAMLFGFGPGDAQACMMAAIKDPESNAGAPAQQLLEQLGKMQQAIGRAPLGVLKKAYEMRDELKATASDADAALDTAASGIGDDGEGYVMDPKARAGLERQIARAKKGDKKAAAGIKKAIESGKLSLSDGSTGEDAAAKYEFGDEVVPTDSSGKANKKQANYKTKYDTKTQQKEAMATITTVDQLVEHAEEILALEESLKNIEAQVVELLNPQGNDALRIAFFTEALTARKKFEGSPENIATHVYITQDSPTLMNSVKGDPPQAVNSSGIAGLHIYKPLDKNYITQIANAATWRGKFRSDSIKVSGKKTGYNLYRSSLIAEIKTASPGGKKYLDGFKNMMNETIIKEAIADGLITEQELLEEGWFGDLADNVFGGVKKVAAAAVKKGGEVWNSFVEKLTKSIDGLLGWFKESLVKVINTANKLFESLTDALQQGVAGVVDFFGITAEEIAAAIEPPEDEQTSFWVQQVSS